MARQELSPRVLAVVAERRVRGLSANELALYLNRSRVPPMGEWSKQRVKVLLAFMAEHPGEAFPLALVDGERPPVVPGPDFSRGRGRKRAQRLQARGVRP